MRFIPRSARRFLTMRTICLLLSFCLRVLMTKYTLAERETVGDTQTRMFGSNQLHHWQPREAEVAADGGVAPRILNSMNTHKP